MAQPGGNAQQGGQQQQPPPAPGGDGLPAEEEHGFPDQLDPEFPEEEEDLDQLDQAALLRLFVRNQQTQNRLIQMMSGGGKAKGMANGGKKKSKPKVRGAGKAIKGVRPAKMR